MTIYYLYVKTHKITGLKYLGKTLSDPFKYIGSGKYWRRHLKIHGIECDTEIIKECSSNEEIKKWGTYYSDIWNIVESSEWANLKPEEGDGGSVFGKDHYLYDKTIYSFRNLITYEIVNMTQNEFCKKYKLSKGNICMLLQGKRNHVDNWVIADSDYKLPIKYTFVHIKTQKIVEMTAREFIKTYTLTPNNVYKMIRNMSGTVKGWKVV